jgi:type I restriction enzyme S subunit
MNRNGWTYKKLGDVASFINGYPFKPEQWKDKGLPIIRIQNLNNPEAPYNYYDGEVPDKVKIKDGDLLISWSASLGTYLWQGGDAYLNQHIFKVLFDKLDIDKMFLKYAVSSKLNEMAALVHGATMKHIVKKDFDNTKIPYPPLRDQRTIVSELDSLNDSITMLQQQVKDIDALAQSIFYDMFGDPYTNDKGFNVTRLGDICSAQNGLVDPREAPYCDMYHVGPANIVSQTGDIVDLKKAIEENLISGKYLFDIGMVLYSKIRPNLNKVAKATFKGICSADMYPLIPKENITTEYLYFILRSNKFLEYAVINSGRANIPKINREALFAYETLLPPLSIQQSFEKKIAKLEESKASLNVQLSEMRTLLASRMQYWFD